MVLGWNTYAPPRVRHSYRVWQRIRKAHRWVTLVCVTAMLAVVATRIAGFYLHDQPIESGFIVLVGVALLAALLVPRGIAALVWNLLWQRHYLDGG